MAWLTTPEGKDDGISRYEKYDGIAGMPELDADENIVLSLFIDTGKCMRIGGENSPLTWQEINAWALNLDPPTSPATKRVIIEMSRAFVSAISSFYNKHSDYPKKA